MNTITAFQPRFCAGAANSFEIHLRGRKPFSGIAVGKSTRMDKKPGADHG